MDKPVDILCSLRCKKIKIRNVTFKNTNDTLGDMLTTNMGIAIFLMKQMCINPQRKIVLNKNLNTA